MNLAVEKTTSFRWDFAEQFECYASEVGAEIALRFETAVDATVVRIQFNPTIGHLRHFKHRRLQALRSIPIAAPFDRILLFYRIGENVLELRRLIPGERDLPHRLPER